MSQKKKAKRGFRKSLRKKVVNSQRSSIIKTYIRKVNDLISSTEDKNSESFKSSLSSFFSVINRKSKFDFNLKSRASRFESKIAKALSVGKTS